MKPVSPASTKAIFKACPMATDLKTASLAGSKRDIDSVELPGQDSLTTNSDDRSTCPSQSSSIDQDLRCDLCNKRYRRLDLRDRHRRRCIAKAGQERKSKRKSCETCAKSKVRCCLSRPSCVRCTQLGAPCRYPSDVIQASAPDSLALAVPITAKQLSHDSITVALADTEHSLEMGGALPASDRYSYSGLDSEPMMAPVADTISLLPTDGGGGDDLSSVQFLNDPSVDDFLSFPNQSDMSLSPWSSAVEALQSTEMDYFSAMESGLGDYSHPGPSVTQQVNHGTVAGGSPSNGTSYPGSSSDSVWHESPVDADSAMSINLDSRMHSQAHLIFGHSFHIGMGNQMRNDSKDLCQEALVHLREYPSLIIDREFWSPFIHHRLYRCSMGGMAEPMANALACVGAYASSKGSSSAFVHRMINQEREKLVRKFHTYTDAPEPCLAALHAVCIYQIMGLFGDTFLPAAVKKPIFSADDEQCQQEEFEKVAELHSSFLLKMSRRLSGIHTKALYIDHQDESDWDQWKFMESLRRNFFFVHIINILGSTGGKLNGNYFEPLGDQMVLNLPLPAPERMWRACSSEEWFLARRQTLEPSTSKLSQRPRTLRQLLEGVNNRQVDVASLLPLTRLILACTIISPPGLY